MVKPRPFWQRLLYPIAGLVLVLAGVAGCILPIIPGLPLIVAGVPLLCSFHPRAEQWSHDQMQKMKHRMKVFATRWSQRHRKQ
jgi:uncharacterized membrane protein YbaN (DUF454 family)